MAYFTYTKDPIGVFTEKSAGNYFEFSKNEESEFNGYPHKIWVGGKGVCGMSGWRYGQVQKTVAYIVVDEDEYGKPVTEKWQIKGKKDYVY